MNSHLGVLLLTAVISAGAQELPLDLDPTVTMSSIYSELKASCPSGIERCECINAPGSYTDGPFNPRDNLLGVMLTIVGCFPGYCFCKDDPTREIDVRNQFFAHVFDTCPRNEINRCLCQEGKKVAKAPFDMVQLTNCRATRCKCNGSNKVKVVKAFGCAKGGVPDCPRQVRPFCKDGTRLTTNYVMRWRGETAGQRAILGNGYKGCVCPDGIMPRCHETGKFLKCPNGDDVDWKRAEMQEFSGCKLEEW